MKRPNIERMYLRRKIATGQILVFLLLGGIIYTWNRERQYMESIEAETSRTKDFRKEVRDVYVHVAELSLLGESILEWNDADAKEYHRKRLELDSLLVRFRNTDTDAGHIDSVRHLLAEKEKQLCAIMEAFRKQTVINYRIAGQVPIIVQNSMQEQPKKPRRKGFLGLFGKKEEAKPSVTTTMLRSFNRNIIAGQQAQSRRLSEHADSLAARNAELNRQLQRLIYRTDGKIQADLQKHEAEISAMREQSVIQIRILTGFILLLLAVSYVFIHRSASRIRRYKQTTATVSAC